MAGESANMRVIQGQDEYKLNMMMKQKSCGCSVGGGSVNMKVIQGQIGLDVIVEN